MDVIRLLLKTFTKEATLSAKKKLLLADLLKYKYWFILYFLAHITQNINKVIHLFKKNIIKK